MQKLWVLNLPLDLPRSWSGVSGHTGVSGPNDRSLRSIFFAAFCVCCGASLDSVRRYPGDGAESPAHRSLRPEDPESPALIFSQPFCICVVRLWIGVRSTPEGARSLRPGRSLRPQGPESPASPMTQQAGVSGHLPRSLRPEQAPTASFWGRL